MHDRRKSRPFTPPYVGNRKTPSLVGRKRSPLLSLRAINNSSLPAGRGVAARLTRAVNRCPNQLHAVAPLIDIPELPAMRGGHAAVGGLRSSRKATTRASSGEPPATLGHDQ